MRRSPSVAHRSFEAGGAPDPRDATTLLLLPASSVMRRPAQPVVPAESARSVLDELRRTAGTLTEGREGQRAHVQWDSPTFAALDYHDGWLFRVPGLRTAIMDAIARDVVGCAILSGAYGLVYATEPVHAYAALFDSRYWARHALQDVLAELILSLHVRRVYAFLPARSGYRRCVEKVEWASLLEAGRLQTAELFSPHWTGGTCAREQVPRALGEATVAFLSEGRRPDAVVGHRFNGLRVEGTSLQ